MPSPRIDIDRLLESCRFLEIPYEPGVGSVDIVYAGNTALFHALKEAGVEVGRQVLLRRGLR